MANEKEQPGDQLIDLGGSGGVRVTFTHKPQPGTRSRAVTRVTLRCTEFSMWCPSERVFKTYDPDYDCDEYGVPLCLSADGAIRAAFYHGGRQWVVENKWSAQHVHVEYLE